MIAYIGRMNYSAAIPNIMKALKITETQAGVIQSVHAVVYAAAQLICGTLANRFRPKRLIVYGLLLSAVFNILFGIAGSYSVMIVVWGGNAFAQALLFTPIMQIISTSFDSETRKKITLIFSICVVAGHLFSWAISGAFAAIFNWRLSFIIPAIILLCAAIVIMNALKEPEFDKKEENSGETGLKISFFALLFRVRLFYIFISCILTGFALEGILNWAPTMIANETASGNTISGTLLSLIIPCIKLGGLFICQYIAKHSKGDFAHVTFLLLLGGAVLSAAAYAVLGASAALFTVGIGFMCAMIYSATNVQSVRLPVQYSKTGRVPQIAGFSDSMIHLGYAISDTATGAVLGAYGSGITILVLGAASLAAAPFMLLGSKIKNKEKYIDG